MFHVSKISFDSKNQKNVSIYEFNKILTMNYDSIGAIILKKYHLDSVISIKWYISLS